MEKFISNDASQSRVVLLYRACKEKELYDLKEKISRIILEGSRFHEELFLEIIETKKAELNTLQQEDEKLQRIAFEISEQLSANNVINSSFDNWASRFDLQDTMGKKSMLINIIDKITVMDHNITVAYKISLTNLCCSLKHSQLVKMGEHGKIPTII